MTRKTFKSALGSPMTLIVEDASEVPGVYLTISRSTILLAPSDAPALALAILEAAGVEPVSGWIKAPLMGSPEQLAVIAQKLVLWIEASESHAKAQAELEAEALELYKAHTSYHHAKSLSEAASPERWLAVARKAREIGAKK